MATLLLRLVAPMQSWGIGSRFPVRETAREPSKSRVIGLLCAALGRPRHQPVDDLARMRMGVRIDRPGHIDVDFHTAQNVYKASGGTKPTEVSRRYYLAESAFLVGVQGEEQELLSRCHQALKDPHWPLFLGRKAFVPAEPVWLPDGLLDEDLLTSLQAHSWLGTDPEEYEQVEALRAVVDDPNGEIVRQDLPLSFALGNRRFAPRRVTSMFLPKPQFAMQEENE